MKSFPALLTFTVLLASLPLHAADRPGGVPEGYRLLYEQDFKSADALKDFVFSDPKAWKFSEDKGRGSVELSGKSKYEPKHRSPFNIALLADREFGDFVLDVELQSTVKPYPHQDMCLFFGFAATNRFYYSHLAVRPNPIKAESHAHDIFIVTNAPRLAIAAEVSKGVTWGENTWHQVRLTRTLADGAIKVFFDDMTTPIMHGTDKTILRGAIGFGSFDDKGRIGRLRIWGPEVKEKKTEYFKPAAE